MDSVQIEKIAHLKSEKIQIYLRIFLIFIVVVTLLYFDSAYLAIDAYADISVGDIFAIVVGLNIVYYFLLLRYPFSYQFYRILFVGICDVSASVYIMYLVGEVSLYYTVLLLWYMIGYGLRYGKDVAYIIYGTILLSWLLLINNAPFWIEHKSFAYSWLITYTILPLYYFHIVNKLKLNLLDLHKDVESSHYEATHDSLTKLANRTAFEEKLLNLKKELKQFGLLFIDLDQFKLINDTHGHHIGDMVLQEFAKIMNNFPHYTARLGGDEFVCIIEYQSEEILRENIDDIMQKIDTKCTSRSVHLSASIGISLYPKDTKDMHILKKKADEAMYEAKKRGKNTFVLYGDIVKEH